MEASQREQIDNSKRHLEGIIDRTPPDSCKVQAVGRRAALIGYVGWTGGKQVRGLASAKRALDMEEAEGFQDHIDEFPAGLNEYTSTKVCKLFR